MRADLAAFEEHQRARGLQPDTVRRRVVTVARWLAHLEAEGVGWGSADHHDVEHWVTTLEVAEGVPVGPTTANKKIGDVDAFYRWARREELTRANPTDLVERQDIPRRLPRPAPGTGVLQALAGGRLEDRIAVALMAYAGLRCLEVSALRWGDIDDGWVVVNAGKGGHSRNQPIGPQLRPWLAAGDGADPDSPVFTTTTGKPASPARVSRLVNRHLVNQRCRFTAHQLRHFYATALHHKTGDLVLVAAALGHASISTAQGYAKARPAGLREAIDSMVWH